MKLVSIDPRLRNGDFASMQQSLVAVHAQVKAALIALEALTARESVDSQCLARVRFQLSQASAARRSVISQVCSHLLPAVPASAAAAIRNLQAAEREYTLASRAHIERWSLAAILSNWSDYAAASQKMRWLLRRRLRLESNLLHPLMAELIRAEWKPRFQIDRVNDEALITAIETPDISSTLAGS